MLARIICLALAAFMLLLFCPQRAAATFSIVAVDTATGAVGSAGASCIAGADILSSVHESIGGIHTQAWWVEANQLHGDSLMLAGLDPDSIIGWLVANDSQGRPGFRQYGVVTLAGPGASAAYTGEQTDDWKGHHAGVGYSVQGNILLGPEIITNMETAFLTTEGPLEEKLMAALEAADVPGADTRCLDCDKPAISAFIRVVHPGDGENLFLDEVVPNTACSLNPIPLLRQKYDLWKQVFTADADSSSATVAPGALLADGAATATITVMPLNYLGEQPENVTEVTISHTGDGDLGEVIDQGDGSFAATVTAPTNPGLDTFTVLIDAGNEVVQINDQPVIGYYYCGDADGNGLVNISDAVYLIAYIFGGGPAPTPLVSGDADCNWLVNISDAVYLIAYIFGGGPEPCALCL